MAPVSIDLARQRRDLGIEMALQGAVNADPRWPDVALAYLRLFATRRRGATFAAEDVLEAAAADGIVKPPNDKAWGGIFRRAANMGLIRSAGFRPCRKRHASPTVLWESI